MPDRIQIIGNPLLRSALRGNASLMVVMSMGCMVLGTIVSISSMVVLIAFHHSHHFRATGPEKYHRQDYEYATKNDVQNRRVVEGNRCVDDCRMPCCRNPSEHVEQPFDY